MDFIAVDFETPNAHNDSVCAMGITFVKNDSIVFNRHILINPECAFSSRNISVHGICPEHVSDKPTFLDVWQEYFPYFNHYPVVMHNVDFDSAVLYKVAYQYDLVLPSMTFYCTMKLCSENIILPSYSLPSLCEHFSLNLCHHNCGSDSLACAKIMLSMCENMGYSIHSTLSDIEFSERRSHWVRAQERKKKPSKPVAPISAPVDLELPDCSYDSCEIIIPENRFVFTGTLPGISRSAAVSFVESNGGSVSSSVSKKTNYLIVGMEDKTVVGADGKSTKIEKAEELIQQGADIKLVCPRDFITFYNKMKKPD